MKYDKTYIPFLIATFFFISCLSSPDNNEFKIYSIEEIVSTEKKIELSQLNAEVRYIPLEMAGESLIGFIQKIIISDKHIYVFTEDRLLQFSSNGKFIKRISDRGGAENEYIYPTDVFINKVDNHIFINDMMGKIIEYNPFGEYIKSHKTALSLLSKTIIMGKDSYLFESIQVLAGNEQYKLIVRTISNDTISTHLNNLKFDISEAKYCYGDSKSLFSINGEIVYHQKSSDTVYCYNYDTKKLDVRYLFDNPTPCTAKNQKEYNRIVINKLNNNSEGDSKISLIYDIAEDKNYIYATIFTTSQGKQLYLIDKNNGNYYKANFKIENKLFKDSSFFPRWQEDNILIDEVQLDNDSNPTVVIIQAK